MLLEKVKPSLRLKRDKWKLSVDYTLEYLPDNFIVYKAAEDMRYFWRQQGGISAKNAATACCEARPLKYTPYPISFPDTWWLICSACNYAIKANGGTL